MVLKTRNATRSFEWSIRKNVIDTKQRKHMKKILILGLIATLANALWAADSKKTVTAATKRLGDQLNYSWTTTMKEADGSPGKLGTIEGKAETNTLIYLSFVVGGLPVEVCMKGEKGSAKALEGWQSFDEIAQTGGTAAAVVRFLRSYKAPFAESARLAGSVKEFKEEEGAFSGDLKDEAAKEFLLAGARRREGEEAPKTTDAKGSVKFWIKDGALTKYEIKVQGKVGAGDRETDINRTTTVEIKDAGSTKIEVPDEAKQKMS
jgi:hypothetical protein